MAHGWFGVRCIHIVAPDYVLKAGGLQQNVRSLTLMSPDPFICILVYVPTTLDGKGEWFVCERSVHVQGPIFIIGGSYI